MNNASNNRSTAVPAGTPVAGNAARRAASQSIRQLGRRFAVAPAAVQVAPVAPITAPAVALETVLATYNMFRAA